MGIETLDEGTEWITLDDLEAEAPEEIVGGSGAPPPPPAPSLG